MTRADWLLVAACAIIVLFFAVREADARRVGDVRCEADGIPNEFDPFFVISARRHMPHEFKGGSGACILKTICWNESRHNPDAVSWAGAEGLCQVMPATAKWINQRGWWRGNLRNAKDNSEAAAIVWTRKWQYWSTPRATECHVEVTNASYNAGEGNVQKAQNLSGGALCWESIRSHMHEVTGEHAKEVIDYVSRFWSTWRRLRGYGL